MPMMAGGNSSLVESELLPFPPQGAWSSQFSAASCKVGSAEHFLDVRSFQAGKAHVVANPDALRCPFSCQAAIQPPRMGVAQDCHALITFANSRKLACQL